MTYAQSCILRLFTHLAMLQGAITNQRVRLQLNLHITGMERIALCNNTFVVVFCCRELVSWSIPDLLMFSSSCGTTLKRTWVCWGRRWIRTWTTQRLQFTWFSIPAQKPQEVILTFQRFPAFCFYPSCKNMWLHSAECLQRFPHKTRSVLQRRTATVGEAGLWFRHQPSTSSKEYSVCNCL